MSFAKQCNAHMLLLPVTSPKQGLAVANISVPVGTVS